MKDNKDDYEAVNLNDIIDTDVVSELSTAIEEAIAMILDDVEDGRAELLVVFLSAGAQAAASMGMNEDDFVNMCSNMLSQAEEYEEEMSEAEEEDNIILN